MKYGIEIIPFGDLADPRVIADLAREAEAAGWAALSLWDHVGLPFGVADPWVALAAVAAVTSQIKLCVGVAAIPRYRPHLLARAIASLDHLSSGRLILGAGLGAVPEEFSAYGEDPDPRIRGEMLDEGLELLLSLLTGDPTTSEGKHFAARQAVQAPAAMQKPRLPIWIGGESRAALRRAARWDGWIVMTVDETGAITKPPDEIARCLALICRERESQSPFEVAVSGITEAGTSSRVRDYASAGATWWLESLFGLRGSAEGLRKRIRDGPPVW